MQISKEELKNERGPEKKRDPLSIYSCLVYLFMYSRCTENFVIHLKRSSGGGHQLALLKPRQVLLRAPSRVAEVANTMRCDESTFCFWTWLNLFPLFWKKKNCL